VYPWGNSSIPRFGNYADQAAGSQFRDWKVIADYDDGHVLTAPVEESGSNSIGLFGIGGNVWEWTLQERKGRRVVRGASWLTGGPEKAWWVTADSSEQMRIDYDGFAVDPSFKSSTIGFRIVLVEN
jgi:formylglycine-generating enzyme required for sulfatase activity